MRKFFTSTPVIFAAYMVVMMGGIQMLKALKAPPLVASFAPPTVMGVVWFSVLGRIEKRQTKDAEEQFISHLNERNQALIEELDKRDAFGTTTLN